MKHKLNVNQINKVKIALITLFFRMQNQVKLYSDGSHNRTHPFGGWRDAKLKLQHNTMRKFKVLVLKLFQDNDMTQTHSDYKICIGKIMFVLANFSLL